MRTGRRLLSAWSSERFGGWVKPVGKQRAEQPLCNVGVDKDAMQVASPPPLAVDRAVAPTTVIRHPRRSGFIPQRARSSASTR